MLRSPIRSPMALGLLFIGRGGLMKRLTILLALYLATFASTLALAAPPLDGEEPEEEEVARIN